MDATGSRVPISSQLLQDYLKQDVVQREKSIARFMRAMTVVCGVAALLLIGEIGWRLSLSLMAVSGTLGVYYVLRLRSLERGRLQPVMQWVDSAIMVSIPTVICVVDARFYGAEYALTAPPALGWGALIVVCALRAGRALAYAVGALVALEYMAVYLLVLQPQLPPDTLRTLTFPMVLLRCVFLFAFGPLSATLAGHFLRKAREALSAIREKDVMGKYFLHERLGAGGMAEVFRATYSPEGGFEKQVAIKRILPAYSDNAEFLAMFRREAELGSLLIHPNIVQVLDLGRHEGNVFLAMEFVDGMPLSSLLSRLPGWQLPPAAVAYVGAELAAALMYMHGRTGPQGEPLGLVHRDLNPPNILVSHIGEVKLSDFGIARAAHQVAVTQAARVRGKPGYMAPEQAYGLPLDGRTDLFALGLTLHEALTGQPTLRGDNNMDLMLAAIRQEVLPPSHFVPGISPELDAIVMGLLRQEQAERTPSAEVVQSQLLALTGPEAPYPLGRQQLVEALHFARQRQRQEATTENDLEMAPTVVQQTPPSARAG